MRKPYLLLTGVFTLCLVLATGLHAADKKFPSSTSITASRALSATSINSGESITATFTLSNANAAALNAFFYSDNLPSACTVTPVSVKVNGSTKSVTPSASSAGAIYTGAKTYTWLIQAPSAYGGTNTINASNGSVEIKYTISNLGTGSVSLEGYAWAGKLGAETGASTNCVFGYCDPVNITVTFDGWSDNFSDGNYSGWTVGEGSWSVTSGALANSSSGRTSIFAGDASWSDITYTSTITPGSGTDVWAIFRVQDASNYYLYTLQSGKLYKLVNGSYTELASGTAGYSTGTAYTVTVELEGSSIKVYKNGTLALSATDNTYGSGKIGFGSNGASGSFDNAQVTTPSTIISSLLPSSESLPSITLMPNPAASFMPVRVSYTGDAAITAVAVYTLSGQLVAQPGLTGEGNGFHLLTWGSKDVPGTFLDAGTYLIRFRVGSQSVTKHLLIIK